MHADSCVFPKKLQGYGLSEKLLEMTFEQFLKEKPLKWCLKGIPDIGFYQELHPFLKKWSRTCDLTKIIIGRFYIAIDFNYKQKSIRADNVYRLVDKISISGQPSSTLMSYGPDRTLTEIRSMQTEAKQCLHEMENLASEYDALKSKFENSRRQLGCARRALTDITNENCKLVRKCETNARKAVKYSEMKSEYAALEDEHALLQESNTELVTAMSALQNELAATSANSCDEPRGDFTFKTKFGRKYSPTIRKLYYTLLSEQVPSSKIPSVIKTVIKCFFPAIDVEELKLPQRACADYMRRDELETVSSAHKAMILCEQAANKQGFYMNTDGTTKLQRKLGGIGINNMVISVNELPDGSAASIIDDVSHELEKLRKIAHELGMPNANSINWTLITASTSDSAASQKKFNKLVEECRERDAQIFEPATVKTVELVESICSMHLGVNLRKAFLTGIEYECEDTSNRKYHPIDVFVHEFCKVFGKHGTPEYGCGVLDFQDFLMLMLNDPSLPTVTHEYFKFCTSINLHRQIGSRYFVTASNAVKIVFLQEAAIKFLEYTGKDNGNKLELDLYTKLKSCNEMAMLRADALMYFHVYADLVMLSKSNELRKSVLDMNKHYFELKSYLERLE